MEKPIVAIIGRPNVGKSTLFNQILGKRISIIDDTPGVTRDRIYADTEWQNKRFTLVDTGGIDTITDDVLLNEMKQQAEVAIDTADVIVFLLDGRSGMTREDEAVGNILRKAQKPVVVAVNKIDTYNDEDKVWEFYNLGMNAPVLSISSSHKRGLGDLLEEITSYFPDQDEDEDEDDIIRIAVVGKPNVGKSSLVNRLLGQDRVIVSEIPGTTRDAIDTPLTVDGKKYIIIDTAGIRRKSRISEDLERYSVIRALSAIRRCDIALIMIDSIEEASEQDTKIAGLVHEEGRGSILVMNKWDAIDKDTHTIYDYNKRLVNKLSFMTYAPTIFMSALTGQRTHKIWDMVNDVYAQFNKRIPTGVLNDCLNDATAITPPPTQKGRRLKIYYGTQVSTKPPTFVLFVNDSGLMHYSYQRYLENYFRKTFGLDGTPIRIMLRQKKNDGGK